MANDDNRDSLGGGLVNSPGVKPGSDTPARRAVETGEQANLIIETLRKANVDRNQRNARIMAKYNDERPYRREDLQTEGLGWKANFSSHPLSGLIDRVAPRFCTAIHASRYLTASKLVDSVPNAAQKTEQFRREITSTIRARPEWKTLVADIAQENALFGYTSVGWLDEYRWFPAHFRQDNFFIPAGTKQHSRSAQVLTFVEPIMLHELFELIRDTEAAEAAGWQVKDALDAINDAMPEGLRSRFADQSRMYEDLLRETTLLSASYTTGAKVVVQSHLLVTEITGKISHWVVDNNSNKLLFRRFDQFENMADAAVFFSFQQANGTLHGSKGIGRLAYEMAGIIDRARNEAVDALQLSNKLVIQGDPKDMRRFKASVVGPALLVDSVFSISERKLEPKVAEFFSLDQYLTQLLDTVAGNVSPRQVQQGGEALRSKAAWELLASREEEGRDQVLIRFLAQLSDMVTVMQRRICAEQCSEPDAQATRKRLLKIMSPEELATLSSQPSVEVVKDLTTEKQQQILLAASEGRGHPLYDQKKLERHKLIAQVGADFADDVLLPDNDPTVAVEQGRQQQVELLLLGIGQKVAVSPRDNHRVHLDVLKEAIESALPVLVDAPDQEKAVRAAIEHARLHIQAGGQTDKENYSGDAAFLADVVKRLALLKAHEQAVEGALTGGAPPAHAAQAGALAANDAPENVVPYNQPETV